MGKAKVPRVGGQAIIEGIMMKGPKSYAVAIKKSNGNILLDKGKVTSITDKFRFLKIFILRGIVAFFESLIIGMKTLMFSADYFDMEGNSLEDKMVFSKEEEILIEKREKKEEQKGWMIFGITALSLVLSIGIFFVLPTFLASLFFNNVDIDQRIWFNVTEGVLKVLIFLMYLLIVSRMKDVKRVFQYHGAEHKTINCFEAGEELNVENVRKYSRYHPRCGTSFIFIVMIISIIVFAFFKSDNVIIAILERIVLLPLIAGISYEVISFFGMFKGKFGRALAMPGMWFQCFTTNEPDDLQIFVAITALNAVLDEEK